MAYMYFLCGDLDIGSKGVEVMDSLNKYIQCDYMLSNRIVDLLEDIEEDDADYNYTGMLSVLLAVDRDDVPFDKIFELPGRSFIDGIQLSGNKLHIDYHTSDCGEKFFQKMLELGIINGYHLYTPDWVIDEDDLDEDEIVDMHVGSMNG